MWMRQAPDPKAPSLSRDNPSPNRYTEMASAGKRRRKLAGSGSDSNGLERQVLEKRTESSQQRILFGVVPRWSFPEPHTMTHSHQERVDCGREGLE